MLLYYITDRFQFAGSEASRRRKLLEKIAETAKCGVDFIQLREKDLPVCELGSLVEGAISLIREHSPRLESGESSTRLLINSRTDVAIASGAGGVHLRSVDISPSDVRHIWDHANGPPRRVAISVSCHTTAEVAFAAKTGADFAVFGPVFEKKNTAQSQSRTLEMEPTGLQALKQACLLNIPVIAVGGVTLESACECLNAGAIGIAGIRLFQCNDVKKVVHKLRGF